MPDRPTAIAKHRRAGGRCVGVFPGSYPEELLEAMNLLPVEIWDPPGPLTHSSEHLQPFVCSVVHRGLELLLSRKPDLDALLFPHICDSLQNLFTIVTDCIEHQPPTLMFYPPRNREVPGCLEYVAGQLKTLASQLEKVAGRTCSDAALAEALSHKKSVNRDLSRLYDRRAAEKHAPLSASQFYAALRMGEFTTSTQFLPIIRNLLDARPEKPFAPEARVVLSGLLPDSNLLAALDEALIAVVEDDLLSCGRRFSRSSRVPEPLPSNQDHSDPDSPFRTDVNGQRTAPDPWTAVAARLLAQPPCPTAGAPLAARVEFIKELVQRSGAGAVVFHTVKFCELELFDHPLLVAQLRESGVPTLLLESELHEPQSGQLATRLAAFLEMLA